ncbi:unnamed protein product, partial [Effrenium voratum]
TRCARSASGRYFLYDGLPHRVHEGADRQAGGGGETGAGEAEGPGKADAYSGARRGESQPSARARAACTGNDGSKAS